MAKKTIKYDKKSHTLTNQELDKTYTFGQRGKRAQWVLDWIEQNGEPNYKPDVETVNPEDYEVSYDKETKTFTNHTLDKTYTYGQRGKKAAWVSAFEEKEGITPPAPSPKITPVNAEDVVYDISFDEDTMTITNNTIGKSYTIGQKGKRAKWASKWIEENQDKVPQKTPKNSEQNSDTQEEQPKFKPSPTGLREWHFRSEMNNQCIIVAKTVVDALLLYNQTTKFPLTKHGLDIFWQETDYMCGFEQGVWRFDPETESWESYGEYKNLQKIVENVDEEKIIEEDLELVGEDEQFEENFDKVFEALAEDEATQNFD